MPPTSPILVTGATGFVGSQIVQELLRQNFQPRALIRNPTELPPGVESAAGNILDSASLAAAAHGCHAIIHLVGIIAETKDATFQKIHVEGTRNLLAAARAAGIERFLHMSALGTRPSAVATYHQTKWQAEELVRASGLAYTIFRPSLILGPNGEFTRMLQNWTLGKAPPFFFMPYFGQGILGQTNPHRIQPIYVEDLAKIFVDALTTPTSINKTYALAGPETYTWPEFLRKASQLIRGRPKLALGIPAWYARFLTALPIPLPFNRDQIIMSQEENTANTIPLLADFPQAPLHSIDNALPRLTLDDKR